MDVRSQLKNAQLEQTAADPTQKSKIIYDTDDDLIKYGDGSGTKTIVEEASTQTLTNKTIDADNNTISNLAHGGEVDDPSSGVHGVMGSVVGTTDSQTLTNKTLTSPVLNTGVSGTAILDEDNMASDSDTQLATQQSIKAYADTKAAKSTLTTKGDIYAASAASTPARLGVGANNTVLTADSAEATGLRWASVGSLSSRSVVAKTSAYTATTGDDTILCDASSAGFTITLYAASGNSGRRLTIKKTDSSFNLVTIDGNSSETIEGSATRVLCTEGDTMVIECDGTDWHIVERYYPKIWNDYSVTITGTTTNPAKATTTLEDQGQWYRLTDNSVVVRYDYQHTNNSGATAGSGSYGFSIPSGLTIDTSKVKNSGVFNMGSAFAFTGAAYYGAPFYLGATANVGLNLGDNTQNFTMGSAAGAMTNSTIQISFKAEIPISGWS